MHSCGFNILMTKSREEKTKTEESNSFPLSNKLKSENKKYSRQLNLRSRCVHVLHLKPKPLLKLLIQSFSS